MIHIVFIFRMLRLYRRRLWGRFSVLDLFNGQFVRRSNLEKGQIGSIQFQLCIIRRIMCIDWATQYSPFVIHIWIDLQNLRDGIECAQPKWMLINLILLCHCVCTFHVSIFNFQFVLTIRNFNDVIHTFACFFFCRTFSNLHVLFFPLAIVKDINEKNWKFHFQPPLDGSMSRLK